MAKIDINVENYKDITGLKKKLFQIFKAITARLDFLENNAGGVDPKLENRVALIENNYMSKAQQFPLGYETTSFYPPNGVQTVPDNSTITMEFNPSMSNNPYVSRVSPAIYRVEESGLFNINSFICFGSSQASNQHCDLNLRINGQNVVRDRNIVTPNTNQIGQTSLNVSSSMFLEQGDEITIAAYQNSSPNQSRAIFGSPEYTNLQITYLGKNDDTGFTPVPVPENYQIPDGSVTPPKLEPVISQRKFLASDQTITSNRTPINNVSFIGQLEVGASYRITANLNLSVSGGVYAIRILNGTTDLTNIRQDSATFRGPASLDIVAVDEDLTIEVDLGGGATVTMNGNNGSNLQETWLQVIRLPYNITEGTL